MDTNARFKTQLASLLADIYPEENVQALVTKVEARLAAYPRQTTARRSWDATDIMLITYGDAISSNDKAPLETLGVFAKAQLQGLVSNVHILPCYPFTSDDGFAVSDYRTINPELGDWSHIGALRKNFELMFDLAINHSSSAHAYFTQFLKDEAPGNAYFMTAPIETDVSAVTRPRASALLQTFETTNGPKHVWCTFSRDQVDWNFKNPDVLLEFVDIVAMYVTQGATWLRLDAIAYLWKELGTACVHLPQTHAIVKLLRLVSCHLNPQMTILTETNVPNEENLSYFGHGDEAHVVYNFSLPPLVLHALLTGNGEWLHQWCSALPELPDGCTYLNFIASHDGIGVRPAEGIIPDDELAQVFATMADFGGLVTYRTRSDGSKSPYEVNISLFDAFKGTVNGEDDQQIARFLCSQANMLSLAGIPAVYYNSLFATPNYYEGVQKTKRNRTINRRKWTLSEIEDRLKNTEGVGHTVFNRIKAMIGVRRNVPAFDPAADQRCLMIDSRLFTVIRDNAALDSCVVCIFNLSNETVTISLDVVPGDSGSTITNLIKHESVPSVETHFTLSPYEFAWFQRQ